MQKKKQNKIGDLELLFKTNKKLGYFLRKTYFDLLESKIRTCYQHAMNSSKYAELKLNMHFLKKFTLDSSLLVTNETLHNFDSKNESSIWQNYSYDPN